MVMRMGVALSVVVKPLVFSQISLLVVIKNYLPINFILFLYSHIHVHHRTLELGRAVWSVDSSMIPLIRT